MNEQVQQMLDDIERHMNDASWRTYSGPAGTRVLYTLVTMLAKQVATSEQQRQVEAILDIHQTCVKCNGVVKEETDDTAFNGAR